MGQSSRICQRLGAFGGTAIGLIFWGVLAPVLQIVIAGFLVALLVTIASTAFLLVIGGYRVGPLLIVSLVISLVEGLLLAPLASFLPDLLVSMLVCGSAGMLLGWLLCQLLCRYGRLPLARGPR
jgi:hypothetical protein